MSLRSKVGNLYEYDFAIIGGGIMGLTLAHELSQMSSSTRILVIEKENHLGFHASGRNSGVLHAGFYYSSESLKAKHCKDGNALMKRFLNLHGIPINNCGKVVVAKNERELDVLEPLFSQGVRNGINLELLPAELLRDYEPYANTVGKFIWSPETAVINPNKVIEGLTQSLQETGVKFLLNTTAILNKTRSEIILEIDGRKISAKWILNAAGAFSESLAKQVGVGTEYISLPFLGKYFAANSKQPSATKLIYPVPNLKFPFLGNHLTITPEMSYKIGPTAFPTLGRENYEGNFPILQRETFEIMSNFLRFSKENSILAIRLLASELYKRGETKQVRDIQRIFPSVKSFGKMKHYPSGIRSQLYNVDTKSLENDFVVRTQMNSVHLLNLVSPGWTASFSLSRSIVNQIVN